ncbi:hypothetical protein BJV82DRAFT_653153 [Fennellomyces sp. T-0311]|nr:hypothetical protein BJV82DRAFT_653153 [Fennellomyces sp. T-0311]
MPKSRHDGVAHITLLVLIQWISIAVIILNAFSLSTSSEANQGLIAPRSGPQDFLLLILGSVSLLGSSLLLCLHLHVYFQLIGDRPYAPSKAILGMEMAVGVILIGLWASATSIIVTNFQVSSPCTNSKFVEHYGQACDLLSNAIILAFVAIAAWLLVILAALFTMTRSSMHSSATVFTVECPVYTTQPPSMYTIYTTGGKSSTTQSFQKPSYPSATVSKPVHYDYDAYDAPKSHEKSRGAVKSWCSEYSTASTATLGEYNSASATLGDLPRIQEGMSCMDLTFAPQSYEEKKTYLQ